MHTLSDVISISSAIQLEKVGLQHAESLFNHIDRHRDYLSHFMHWPRFTHQLTDSQDFIRLCMKEAEQGESFVWAICVAGNALGTISLNKPIDWQNRTALIGYWLSPDVQGKGIVTQAVHAVINATQDYFSTYILRCAVHNERSNKVAQRSGFVFSHVQEHAEKIGEIMYAQNIYCKSAD